MEYKPTSTSAIEFANANMIEEWIHLFLCGEGNNKAFSDGLKLEPRRYYKPEIMYLDTFKRCCGPELDMKFRISETGFAKRVDEIAEFYQNNECDIPPLIIYRDKNGYELNDGNHRYEALKKLGIDKCLVIIWETVAK